MFLDTGGRIFGFGGIRETALTGSACFLIGCFDTAFGGQRGDGTNNVFGRVGEIRFSMSDFPIGGFNCAFDGTTDVFGRVGEIPFPTGCFDSDFGGSGEDDVFGGVCGTRFPVGGFDALFGTGGARGAKEGTNHGLNVSCGGVSEIRFSMDPSPIGGCE